MELFPLEFEKGRKCPKTGLWIPTSAQEVQASRLDILEKAGNNEELQGQD